MGPLSLPLRRWRPDEGTYLHCLSQGLPSEGGRACGYTVTGNGCPRGEAYGKRELTHPTRVITSTVRCTGGIYPRCPVKTSGPVPKERVFDVVATLDSVTVTAPVRLGAGGGKGCLRHRGRLCGYPGAAADR